MIAKPFAWGFSRLQNMARTKTERKKNVVTAAEGGRNTRNPLRECQKKTDDAFCKQRNPESNVCGMEWDMIVDKIYVDGVDGKSRKRRPDRRVQNSKKWA